MAHLNTNGYIMNIVVILLPAELLSDEKPEIPKNENDLSKKELDLIEKYRSVDSRKKNYR